MLRTPAGFVVVDFEGEPMRPIEERRALGSPMRDLATLLRSFDHVSTSAERRARVRGWSPDEHTGLDLAAWRRRSRERLLRSYGAGLRRAGSRITLDERLLVALEVAKECDEFVYAATYLPTWLWAPHEGMRRLIEGDGARAARSVGEPGVNACAGPPTARDGFDVAGFRRAVLDWYDAQGRTLPFRGTTDPYLVLVSETILQQTQVSRGGPAWEAFVERFPTVEALAAATPADVLRAWRGLGYNRRALNLHRAARMIVGELGGRFPTDVAGLERLPGVGPYTARAVASIAFGLPVGAVDTNVRRVLGRAVGGGLGALRARDLQAVADALVPPDRPADWTHAVMDIGSLLCRPRAPRCGACPVVDLCRGSAAASASMPEGAVAARPTTPVPSADAQVVVGISGRATRERRPPFEQTSRWLRGRILDRLRAAHGDEWVEVEGELGIHDRVAIDTALAGLLRDGLLELRPGDPPLARLPLG